MGPRRLTGSSESPLLVPEEESEEELLPLRFFSYMGLLEGAGFAGLVLVHFDSGDFLLSLPIAMSVAACRA